MNKNSNIATILINNDSSKNAATVSMWQFEKTLLPSNTDGYKNAAPSQYDSLQKYCCCLLNIDSLKHTATD